MNDSDNPPARLLGLDLGERRIGLAVSPGPNLPIFPIGHLDRGKLQQDIQRVIALADQREVQGFVVGMPYTLSGQEGTQARKAQGFARALRRRTALPVYTCDETFTSVEAEGLLREAGWVRNSRDRGRVDATAAALILQRFLDNNPSFRP